MRQLHISLDSIKKFCFVLNYNETPSVNETQQRLKISWLLKGITFHTIHVFFLQPPWPLPSKNAVWTYLHLEKWRGHLYFTLFPVTSGDQKYITLILPKKWGGGTLLPLWVKVADKEKISRFLKLAKTGIISFLDIILDVPNPNISLLQPIILWKIIISNTCFSSVL